MDNNILLMTDVYKLGHAVQYPKGTTKIYSYLIARKSRLDGVDKVVFFGLQYYLKKYLSQVPTQENLKEFIEVTEGILGKGYTDFSRFQKLIDLGYFPIKIRAVEEGTKVDIGNVLMTIENTHPDFFWLVNYIETMLLKVWYPITVATVSNRYRELCKKYADKTASLGASGLVPFQVHDFGYRSVSSEESAAIGDAAHLINFLGTDTIAGIRMIREYYAPKDNATPIGLSVPASEHSVMCAWSQESEDDHDAIKNMLKTYPTGIVSIVADTYDLWRAVDYLSGSLFNLVMARDGKTVIRPDSGDPVKIICGEKFEVCTNEADAKDFVHDSVWTEAKADCEGSYNCGCETYERFVMIGTKYYKVVVSVQYNRHDKEFYYVDMVSSVLSEILPTHAQKGLIRLLDERFGSTVNEKGFKELNPKIGAIYGDAIHFERAEEIFKNLEAMGYASTNIVFGVGGLLLQGHNRDTFGFAIKATYAEINGQKRNLMKNPVTDPGKRSHCGRVSLLKDDKGKYYTVDKESYESEKINSLLTDVYVDGNLIKDYSLEDIRGKL